MWGRRPAALVTRGSSGPLWPMGGERGRAAIGLTQCSSSLCGACVFIWHRSGCRRPRGASPAGRRPRPAALSRRLESPVSGRFTPVGILRCCRGSARAVPALTLGRLCRQEHSRSHSARCPTGPLQGRRPGQGRGSTQVSAAQHFCVRVQNVYSCLLFAVQSGLKSFMRSRLYFEIKN